MGKHAGQALLQDPDLTQTSRGDGTSAHGTIQPVGSIGTHIGQVPPNRCQTLDTQTLEVSDRTLGDRMGATNDTSAQDGGN